MKQPRKVLRSFQVPEHVPEALRELRQWICWREKWNPKKGKPDKKPACVATGGGEGFLTQKGHSTYQEAIEAVARMNVDGVGFTLMDGEIVGGDLDNCRDPATGVIETWALRLIALNETYCEVTPSGKGIRFFAFGALPNNARSLVYESAQVELYVGGRFLTFTGDHIAGTPMEIRPAPWMVEALIDRVTTMKARDGVAEAPQASRTPTFAQWIYQQTPYGRINQAALARLGEWVPELFPTAEFQPGTKAWRVKSADLGRRDLQEDLSIHPDGGKNFGVHDMGDPRGGKLSPIDIVTIHHPLLSTKEEAVEWLAETLNISFGDAGQNKTPVARPRFRTLAEFIAEYEPVADVIDGLVSAGSLYTMTGVTGTGKTGLLSSASLSVITGRADILKRKVMKGRVAFSTAENPDGLKMRLAVSADYFGVDPEAVGRDMMISDVRTSPEAIYEDLRRDAKEHGPFALVIIDTWQAFFDGKDSNNPTEALAFTIRFRPLTRLPGGPAVIMATHPIKNAAADNLIPYGGGSILNEVDGNLTLSRQASGLIALSWQGKLRGLDFEPPLYQIEQRTCPTIVNIDGDLVKIPVLSPVTADEAEAREDAGLDLDERVLRTLADNPQAAERGLALVLKTHRNSVKRALMRMAGSKPALTRQELGQWVVTKAGNEALKRKIDK